MKLYIDTKKMTFEEDNIEHEIITRVKNVEFLHYDYMIELPDNDTFIKDTLKIFYKKDKRGEDTKKIDHKEFIVREQKTWWSFPLYQIINKEIVPFDYTQHQYFIDTDRRMTLAKKISKLYNSPSEAKISRRTFKYIMDTLDMEYPDR